MLNPLILDIINGAELVDFGISGHSGICHEETSSHGFIL